MSTSMIIKNLLQAWNMESINILGHLSTGMYIQNYRIIKDHMEDNVLLYKQGGLCCPWNDWMFQDSLTKHILTPRPTPKKDTCAPSKT